MAANLKSSAIMSSSGTQNVGNICNGLVGLSLFLNNVHPDFVESLDNLVDASLFGLESLDFFL
jgi:hypothetical protein